MQTRRFTLAIPDKRGQPRRGEVLLTERWLLAAPSRPETSLLADLLRAHPEISEASLDAAVAEFRRLLAQELAAQRQSHPTREPRIVLDARAAPRAPR